MNVTMLASLQLVTPSAVPFSVTVLAPGAAPKFLPAIVTAEPYKPEVGLSVLMTGAGRVKFTLLLTSPPTVTVIALVACSPTGAETTMLVALQLVGKATMPLNVTVLLPCAEPKFAPAIVTEAPTDADAGFRLEILGAAAGTVNAIPLLACPLTVTTTLPLDAPAGTATVIVVEFQVVGAEDVPLKVTPGVPTPKFVPVIVTTVPTAPEVGLRVAMFGIPAVVVVATLEYGPKLFEGSLARTR
jgi:hypothetical protein